jgi:lysozyme
MKWLAALFFGIAHPAAPPTTCVHDCAVSPAGYEMTRTFEGFMPFAYADVGGKQTIGFGHLIKPGETFAQPLLPADADAMLHRDMRSAERSVNEVVEVELRQGQFDSLADFTFNLGAGSLKGSTLLKCVNADKNSQVPGEFMKWVNVNKKPNDGLIRRRKAEADLYVG